MVSATYKLIWDGSDHSFAIARDGRKSVALPHCF